MALTSVQVKDLIDANLSSGTSITAVRHRETETAIVDFVASSPCVKKLTLSSFVTDRQFSVTTGLPAGSTILGVTPFLQCAVNNNGFVVGDIITAPTPYPGDSGRTSEQGIGVQWRLNDKIYVMVSDELTVSQAYNSTAEATVNNFSFSGASCSNWNIVLMVNFAIL